MNAKQKSAKAGTVQLPHNKTLVLRAMFTDVLGGGTEPPGPVLWTSSDLAVARLEATADPNAITVVPSVNLGVVTVTMTAGDITETYDVEVTSGVAVAVDLSSGVPQPMTDAQLARQEQQKAAVPLPVNVDIPNVSQNAMVLNCTMGNWDGEPTSYAYQWQVDGVDVGTDAPDLPVQVDQAGKTAVCIVTATNVAGSTTAPPSVGLVIEGARRRHDR